MIKRLTSTAALSAVCLVMAGCPCPSNISVVRGDSPPTQRTVGRKAVHICPGESATLAWKEDPSLTRATVNTLGSVSVPEGFQTVKPTDTTVFTIKGEGEDCSSSDNCTVYVVKDGDKAQVGARLVEVPPEMKSNLPITSEKFKWVANLDEGEWSPSILVTSIRMVRFGAPNEQWNKPASWYVHKIDGPGTEIPGFVHDFPITWEFSSPFPKPIPAVDNWTLWPLGGLYLTSPPPVATFEFTMQCKPAAVK